MKKGNNEGSIRKRSNGTWEGRYSDGRDDNGKQIQRSVYGKTRKEVSEKLNSVLHRMQTGTYISPNDMNLKDWLLQWLKSYALVSVRPSTYVSYEGYIHNHIIPNLGDIPIQQVNPTIIQNFYIRYLKKEICLRDGTYQPKKRKRLFRKRNEKE